MSIARLQLEQEIREAEAERDAEARRLAQALRAEAELPEPRAAKVIPMLVNPYDECAELVAGWWGARVHRKVTKADVRALVQRLRKLGGKR